MKQYRASMYSLPLIVILGLASSPNSFSSEDKIEYSTACGPIAAYVGLRSLGLDPAFHDVVDGLGWREGGTTTLVQLIDYLGTYKDLNVRAVRLTPHDLIRWLSKGVAVVPIKKNSDVLNHLVCVTNASDKMITYIDYPELAIELPLSEFLARWDGQAILITRSNWKSLSDNIVFILSLTLLTLTAGAISFRNRRSSRHALVAGYDDTLPLRA